MCVYYTLLQKIITGKCERKINHGKCSCTDFLVRFGGFSFSASLVQVFLQVRSEVGTSFFVFVASHVNYSRLGTNCTLFSTTQSIKYQMLYH